MVYGSSKMFVLIRKLKFNSGKQRLYSSIESRLWDVPWITLASKKKDDVNQQPLTINSS